MMTLRIEGDGDLEDAVQAIVSALSDEELDAIELEREAGDATGIAYEPMTVAAIITASTPIALAAIRLLDRWLARQDQRKTLRLVWDATGTCQ
jgi:hypothetical protein